MSEEFGPTVASEDPEAERAKARCLFTISKFSLVKVGGAQ